MLQHWPPGSQTLILFESGGWTQEHEESGEGGMKKNGWAHSKNQRITVLVWLRLLGLGFLRGAHEMRCVTNCAVHILHMRTEPVGYRKYVVPEKCKRLERIFHRDMQFFIMGCNAKPAGSVFFTSALVHKSAFFTNFTLRTLLKRNYCNILMFWVQNWSEILGFY